MKRLACLVLVVACSGGSPEPRPAPPTPATPEPSVTQAPTTPIEPTFPNVPATDVGAQLAWMLDKITHGGEVSEAEITAHFHESFLAALSPPKLVAFFRQVGISLKGIAVTEVEGSATNLVALATVGAEKVRIFVMIDPATKLITTFVIKPVVDTPKPKSYGEAKEMLSKLAPHVQLLVAEAGTCKPVAELFHDEQRAIGSTGKLYILLGLADRITKGKATWDDEIAVRDDWKSLPTGITQKDAAGTKLSLRKLAERMISISDNTATDHLVYTLGRREVEAAVRATKHAKPALDTPFMTTREFFMFKTELAADEVARYLAMPEAKRRAYLDMFFAGKAPSIAKVTEWTTARHIDKIEWFASSLDLCRVMSTLKARAANAKAAPVLDVLAINPGLQIDKAVFPYVGFKGGSEPGVMSLTYLLRRSDDKWFVATLTANTDAGGALEEEKLIAIAQGMISVLGQGATPSDALKHPPAR